MINVHRHACHGEEVVLFPRHLLPCLPGTLLKTYIAEVPAGYEGGFGPTLQAWLKLLYYQGNMSEPMVHSVLTAAGVQISEGQVSNLVLKVDAFEAELTEAYVAMLENCPWQGTDDTSTKINGVAHYCHVV